jgi:hemolysin activation/secretion protein
LNVISGVAQRSSDRNRAFRGIPAANFVAWHDQIVGAQRDFETFTGTASAQFSLKEKFSLSTLGSWQWTGAKLLPGDQIFTVGGPVTVRGYPTNAVSGDSGYYVNVELHRDMSDFIKGLDVYVFLDNGATYSTFPSEVDLTSTGFGGSWSPVPSLTFEANYGAPWRSVVLLEAHYQAYGRVIFRPLLLSHS